MTSSDQRQHHRLFPTEAKPIRVDINGSNFLDVLPAKNLSEQGIGFDVPHEFKGCAISEDVKLIVLLPTSPAYSISVSATIRHVAAQTFGASFINLERKDLKVLRRYISDQLGLPQSFLRKLLDRLRV